MNKRINFFSIVLLFFFYNTSVFSENKILFIDIDYIYANSTAGKKVKDKIKIETKKIQEELSKYQKEIKDDKDKLVNQKNVLSQEELKKKSVSLEKKAKDYNKIISDKNKKLSKYVNNANIKFYQILTKVVQEYSTNNSIEMIIKKQSILIGKKSLDATQDILDLFNKNIKDIKIN